MFVLQHAVWAIRYRFIELFLTLLINLGSVILTVCYILQTAHVKSISEDLPEFIMCIFVMNMLFLNIYIRAKITIFEHATVFLIKTKIILGATILIHIVVYFFLFEIKHLYATVVGLIFETSAYVLETREHVKVLQCEGPGNSPSVLQNLQLRQVHPLTVIHAEVHTCEDNCPVCPCPVCLENISQLITLNCKHSLCFECAKKIHSAIFDPSETSARTWSIKCPCCRQLHINCTVQACDADASEPEV